MHEPLYQLYRLVVLRLPARFKKRLKEFSFCTDKLQPGLIRISALWAALATEVRKRSVKPVVINQQPWSGPLVSVIVTCYNYGAYLDQVLGCLEAQSWQNFEIILIDDGSTDPETITRIDELKKLRQPNLKIMQQLNQGVIAARNNAIAEACGKYIFPLDADDTIDKSFLEKCLLFLENSAEHFFVYTWVYSTGADDFIWETRDSSPVLSLEENKMGYAVFRKTAFDQVGGYNPVMAGGYEDWELCVNLVAHGYVGRVIREPLYNYYVKPGARNFHAHKKHETLKRKIGNLHRATIKAQKKRLLQLAQESYRVNHYLVNLAGDTEAEGASRSFLLDLYNSDDLCNRDVEPLSVFKDILLWAGNSSTTIFLTLDIRWREHFTLNNPENLFVYYPEQYHPEHDVKPFYDYLEHRYQPRKVTYNWIKERGLYGEGFLD